MQPATAIPSAIAVAATLFLAGAVHAQPAPAASGEHAAHHPALAASSAVMAQGEVRKVDKAQAKLTLRHGPIASLDMPGMTMVFRVADPTMLDAVREGDQVRFQAERMNGAITVTAIEVAK